MLLMANPPKKKAAGKAPPTAVEPKAKPNRTGKPVNVWLPTELHDALGKFRDAQRVKPAVTDIVELAIQEFLQREGFWGQPASKS